VTNFAGNYLVIDTRAHKLPDRETEIAEKKR
jgi:hypothetical protein